MKCLNEIVIIRFSLHKQGLTLEELANVLIEHRVRYAINLDGGGSSTLVHNGKLVNRPFCMDVPITCERPVASVVCLKSRRD
jgi:exopolysaccharide biosynthesis protein